MKNVEIKSWKFLQFTIFMLYAKIIIIINIQFLFKFTYFVLFIFSLKLSMFWPGLILLAKLDIFIPVERKIKRIVYLQNTKIQFYFFKF